MGKQESSCITVKPLHDIVVVNNYCFLSCLLLLLSLLLILERSLVFPHTCTFLPLLLWPEATISNRTVYTWRCKVSCNEKLQQQWELNMECWLYL